MSISPIGTHFSVSSDPCSGKSLAAGATCTVTVSFAPAAPGSENATLTFGAAATPAASTPLSATASAHLTIVLDTTWCGGSVTSTNGVVNCGSTCEADVTSNVILNAQATNQTSRPCYFDGWLDNGCSGTGACTAQMTGNRTFQAHFSPRACVDPVSGNDTNAGTCSAPFKTLTHALTGAFTTGDVVQLKPGVYSVASGETFPIKPPSGVSIIGNETTKGPGAKPTEIAGSGLVDTSAFTFVLEDVSAVTIAGLKVTAAVRNDNATGFLVSSVSWQVPTDAIIRNSVIRPDGNEADGAGIRVNQNATTAILGNDISGFHAGLYLWRAGVKVETSTIRGNAYGVYIDQQTASLSDDLGGGSAGSIGHNILSCNSIADVYFSTLGGGNQSVQARFNSWDRQPPGSCSDRDICVNGGGGVDASDSLSPPTDSCP